MKKRPPKLAKPKPKQPRRPRPKFYPAGEEMKAWASMLGSELSSLPSTSTKPMFGFLAFYRHGAIFAALPKTRGFNSASSIMLKFNPLPDVLLKRAQNDSRLDTNTRMPGKGWFTFELSSETDLRDALFWLNQAYDAAAN
ncbi:MAG TPA: hypothetical protein VII25_11835 [Candidatus Acidoferrum sp.]|jgi:hypothetical protein